MENNLNKKSVYRKHYDFLILDMLCLIVSYVLAYYIRHQNFKLFALDIYKDTFFAIIVIELLMFFFYNPFQNVVKRGRLNELKETIKFDIISFLVSVTYLFVVKAAGSYSRLALAYTYIMYLFFSYLIRILWKNHIYNKSYDAIINGEKSLLIISRESELEDVLDNIYENNYDYYKVSGLCVIDKDIKGKLYKGYKVVANLDTILDYVSTNWVDDIFIATDYTRIPQKIIKGFVSTNIPIHIKLDNIEIFGERPQIIDKLGSFNVITSINKNYNEAHLFVKRITDIIGGIIGCAITLLLTIIIGPIIYLKSPGNIFYVSNRVGKNGKIFKFYKFRSMRLNADEMKKDLVKSNLSEDGMMFKIHNDPRVISGIGQFIRKTSLDEFPQFYNVLKGDMSLVGTRPPTIDEWNKYSPYYRSRLSIKPGITGLWQVSGRSNITNFEEVVRLDNEYINNWSLLLDVKIIIKTIRVVFNGDDNGAM